MVERHPFGDFVPNNAKYLIIGSFPGKAGDPEYDWFYGSKRSQFWKFIESVYSIELRSKKAKIVLLTKLGMAMTDIIHSCVRVKNSNLDVNLNNIIFNIKGIEKILKENKIGKIYFTSRFVETKFKSKFKGLIANFPEVELIALPSPSPRFAAMKLEEKIRVYKKLLP